MNTYESPFSRRYGSGPMHLIWAESTERNLWRATWLQLALQLDLPDDARIIAETLFPVYQKCSGINDADLEEARQVEIRTKHDVVAELEVFKRTLGPLSGYIHAGATSSDVQDIANMTRIRWSLGIIMSQLKDLNTVLGKMVKETAAVVCMGRTHLQPAEPTTFGYRMAVYLQELTSDFELLMDASSLPGSRGVRGAVGTGSNILMFTHDRDKALERMLIGEGDFPLMIGQTYPRTIEYRIAAIFSTIAATLHKLGLDMRYLQSLRLIGSVKRPEQIGSSAMPSKNNPIAMEKTCALSRKVVNLAREIWDAAAMSMLERTLDDSAGRRSALPEIFMSLSEALISATRSLEDTVLDEDAMEWECHEYWRQWIASRALALNRAVGVDAYAQIEKDVQEAITPFEFIYKYFGVVTCQDLYCLETASYFANFAADVSRDQLENKVPSYIIGLLGDFPWTPPPPKQG